MTLFLSFVIPSFPSYRYRHLWRQKIRLPNQKIFRYSFLSQQRTSTYAKLIVTMTWSPCCRYYHSVHCDNPTSVSLISLIIAFYTLHAKEISCGSDKFVWLRRHHRSESTSALNTAPTIKTTTTYMNDATDSRPQWYYYNSVDKSYRNAYHRYDQYDFAMIGKQD